MKETSHIVINTGFGLINVFLKFYNFSVDTLSVGVGYNKIVFKVRGKTMVINTRGIRNAIRFYLNRCDIIYIETHNYFSFSVSCARNLWRSVIISEAFCFGMLKEEESYPRRSGRSLRGDII